MTVSHAPIASPPTTKRIEVVTIGDELLLGFTIDTNAAHLARALASIGMHIVRRTTVGDAADAIATAVREALDRTGAVITTGGLGPTSDDLTKPAIAAIGPAKWKTGFQLVWQGSAYFWFFAATLAAAAGWSGVAWHAFALFNGTVGTLMMLVAVVLTVYSFALYLRSFGSVFATSPSK